MNPNDTSVCPRERPSSHRSPLPRPGALVGLHLAPLHSVALVSLHLEVGDVPVDVHGGCLTILRDVLVILGA